MTEDWEGWLAEYKAQWEQWTPAARRRAPMCPEAAVRRLAVLDHEDLGWLTHAWRPRPEGQERSFPDARSFVLNALREATALDEVLFQPLMEMGIEEVDPSVNGWFIRPCVQAFGHRRVNEYLLEALATGDNSRKAGAVNALYPAQAPFMYPAARREGQEAPEALDDLWARRQEALLTEFVSNDDLHVRRRVISLLNLNALDYPERLRALVPQAIEIARLSADKYIRHRVEVQLGAFIPLMALPDRPRE